MKMYISGPMSGIAAFNIPAFDHAAQLLRRMGNEVLSPAEIDGPVTREILLKSPAGDHGDLPAAETYGFYLSRDMKIIIDEHPDVIVTLPGWKDSKGAKMELAVAAAMGIPQVEFVDIISEMADLTFGGEPLELYENGKFVHFDENPERQRAATGAVKDNRSKALMDLIPYPPLKAMAEVLGYGARKYKPNNWRLGLSWSQTFASLQRHLWAFNEGEDLDPETRLPHLAHAMCQLSFLTHYYLTKTGADDRFVSSDPEEAKA